MNVGKGIAEPISSFKSRVESLSMIFHSRQAVLRTLGRTLLSIALVAGSLPILAARSLALPQSEQDRLFAQAVDDYNNNRFPNAQAKFEQIQGPHAQEAQQYLEKIKAYKEAKGTADDIMRRNVEELDPRSVESAIQEYEKAIRIKSNGPGAPTRKLESARDFKKMLEGRLKQRADDLCDKLQAAARDHRRDEAADYSCRLADQDPTYSCGGTEATGLCEQYKNPPQPTPATQRPEVFSEAKAAYEGNDFKGARSLFTMMPADAAAKEYMDKISRYQGYMAQASQLSKDSKYDEARAAFASAANIKADGPGNPWPAALRMELAEGLDQFYSGDYVAAIQHLEDYSGSRGEKQPLAHFYLGASKLARFFLTGSENNDLQQEALKDLKDAKQAGFKAESQDVSPKILKVYHDLVF